MIIGITGSRTKYLGYGNLPLFEKVKSKFEELFLQYNPDVIISGMALGIDVLAVASAIKLNIPFVAAVPFKGQESVWLKSAQEHYHNLLRQAKEVVYVSEPPFSVDKLKKRNKYIVDNSDMMIAMQANNSSGTQHTIEYADSKCKTILIFDPFEL